MQIKEALSRLVEGGSLKQAQMAAVMRQIMTGEATAAQIGGFLVALKIKGETIDEIAGAVQVMRELATPVAIAPGRVPLVDTCGTGGDGSPLFNVSTAAAFVVAAAGGRVAKHGNRSITSVSGSADVLEAAGVHLGLTPEQVARCVEQLGVGFMFAQAHHSAMKHAIGPRKELSLRTIFNILGPMTNPAGVKRQVLGVYSRSLCNPLAQVLGRLGSEHVLVVNADDGLDEISLAAPTHIAQWKDGVVSEFTIAPEDFGIERQSLDGLKVSSAAESLSLIKDALGKRATERGRAAADMVALNAGAAIYVSGLADSLAQGIVMAEDTIATGLALEKLTDLAEMSQVLASAG
ncbi:MAG TPA: anthranilate phosphoribosyltransferase [Cellvibrionaceae bacterium]|nr:anthranilate phosphoribosyltransferase [Cellvibrionaceae bacterium]HMY40109.1 anthranilate phosphoribosyltransferase [Marinagarivorans sp.]